MADRHYTIMIIPGTRAKLLRLRLRREAVLALVAVVGAGLLTAGFLPYSLVGSLQRSREVASLQKENQELREASKEISALREQVAYFENKATKFALMAGVETLPSTQGGGGLRHDGAPGGELLQEDVGNLKERSGVLRQSFDLLEKVYRDQSLLLASTPSISPVRGMISFGYAWRRDPFTGERAFHNGLDIVAPRGSKILATADGVVTKAGREGGYGNVIYLSHGHGLTTRYAHLDGFSVRAGQEIDRGEVIGYVGNTGRSLGAHLHYEVLVNNAKVDPSMYILDDNVGF